MLKNMVDERFWRTKKVASILDVHPNTVRNWILSGELDEPGWGRRGKRKERHYTREWIEQAAKKLGIEIDQNRFNEE